MSFGGRNDNNIIHIFAAFLLTIYGITAAVGKPVNDALGRCPDLNMINGLQESFNLRRIQLLEFYCKKRQQMDGTPTYKCVPVTCTISSRYQTIWQLGKSDFHKRLYVELVLLEKARLSLLTLQSHVDEGETSNFKLLRSHIENDMVQINYIMQACYHSSPKTYPLIKKAINGDFLTFPLSKERATACNSGGKWQQLTFMADLIQLYNDMYDSLIDIRSQ